MQFNRFSEEEVKEEQSEPSGPRPPRREPQRGLLVGVATAAAIFGAVVGTAGAQLAAPRALQGGAVVTAQQAQFTVPASVAGAVYQQVGAAVVELVVSGSAARGVQTGNGSGVVVDSEGLILTNNHVVSGARAISVRFSNGQTREGTLLGTDSANDLALLRVSDLPSGIPVATLGDSASLRVGDPAIAIGSPFGLEQTVTQGIISAVNRTWQSGGGRTLRGLIQTDAPVNPGNSGGPLLNAAGEVVGITNLIESPVRGSVGIGFAVPINTAKSLMPQLAAGVQIEPVWLGITGTELDETIARDQGLSVQSGVLVTSVVSGGPAATAGIRGGQGAGEAIPRGGDVITAIDGNAVTSVEQVSERLAGKKPGDTVQVTIVRDGSERTIAVRLQAWPEERQ
ncbi:MAG: S1C family serine protease [Chloroflexota bacterium]